MRWMILALVTVALAGCADGTDSEPEFEPVADPGPLPQDVLFSDSGALADGLVVVFPFEVDPRAVLIKAKVSIIPTGDAASITNDVTASLMHNGALVATGGGPGVSSTFGNGGSTELFFYEQRIPFEGNLSKFAGTWELRFDASGPQVADYDIDVAVRY